MAWTVPTPADLKASLSGLPYAAVADATVQSALDRHTEMVDDSWPDQAQFTTGCILYACHLMYMAGLGPAAAMSTERSGLDVKLMKAGDRTLEFFSVTEMAGSGADWLRQSPPGREFQSMVKRLFGGPIVAVGQGFGWGWGSCW